MSNDRARYAELVRDELEAGTQMKLLSALADEYQGRSEQTQPNNSVERARLLGELARETRDKSTAALARLNEATKKRLAFESEHGAFTTPAAMLGALDQAKPFSPDELAYVVKLDERILALREEIAFVEESTRGLYAQLQTNTAPESVARASELLDANTKKTKQLQWEQGELDLRKLQFRALRK